MSLADFVVLLEKVPATLWGVAIGGGLTLASVIFTNRATDRRLRKQFEHERQIKNKDRELALRKEVYLTAAEGIVEGINAIMRFADLRIPHDKINDRYIEKAPAIGKIHVIAKEGTAKAFLKFGSELAATYLRLFSNRYPLFAAHQRLLGFDADIDRFGKERDRWLEQIKQYNVEGGDLRDRPH